MNTYRRQARRARCRIGADYRFAALAGAARHRLRSTSTRFRAALDYRLSPPLVVQRRRRRGLSCRPTSLTVGEPARRSARRSSSTERGAAFHVGYMPGVPAVVRAWRHARTRRRSASATSTPLFRSRRFYTDNSAVFRDNQPLTCMAVDPLPTALAAHATRPSAGCRSRWVRSKRSIRTCSRPACVAGGRLDRNRIGFQIVTSKPMRIE